MSGTPLTDAIEALTTYSNTVTGASDTTLSEAVATLASGYGGGGGSKENELLDGTLSGAYSNSDVTNLHIHAFSNLSGVTSADFPNVTAVNANSIYNNINMTALSIPKLTDANQTYCFANNKKLASIIMPKLTGALGTYAFSGCTVLSTADIGENCTSLNGQAFANTAIATLILRRSSAPTGIAVNTFNGTPFASGGTGGTIYIPKTLYDHLGDNSASDYKHASNWSTIEGYGTITWAKIEGSYYETHYADGTVIS